MPFEPAKNKPMRPKVLLYGDPGCGKTVLSLSIALASPLVKLAVIDTEHGTDAYAGQFPFVVKHTDDPAEAEREIDSLLASPGDVTTLVVDSITPLITTMDRMADESLRPRAGSKGQQLSNFEAAWGIGTRFGMAPKRRIEQLMRGFLAKLRRIDMGVIVTARPKQSWLSSGDGGDRVQLRRGDIIPDAIAGLEHEFDLVLHLERRGQGYAAHVKKARGLPALRDVMVIDPLPTDELVRVFGIDAWTRHSEPRPVASDDQVEQLIRLTADLQIEPQVLQKALSARGVSLPAELSPDQAAEMIANLLKRLDAKNNPPSGATLTPAAGQ